MRSDGLKKPERVTVERKKANGQSVPYHVVDSVATFKQSDWDRVCCVFVAGQLWQFKGWKWEKPVELFSNGKVIDLICYIYIYVDTFFMLQSRDFTLNGVVIK